MCFFRIITICVKPEVYKVDTWARPRKGRYYDTQDAVENIASFEASPIMVSGAIDKPRKFDLITTNHHLSQPKAD